MSQTTAAEEARNLGRAMAEQVHQHPDRAAELVRLVPAETLASRAWRLGYLESVVQDTERRLEEVRQMFGRLGESEPTQIAAIAALRDELRDLERRHEARSQEILHLCVETILEEASSS